MEHDIEVTHSMIKETHLLWNPVCSTSKVSDGWIRDLGFNPRLH